jgi:AraC-like DNA-binding protein
MPGSAVHGFTEPDEYRAHLRLCMAELVVTLPGAFSARLIRAELPNVILLRACEILPRVAYLSLPPEAVLISFPTHPKGLPVCAGVELLPGELMFHSVSDRLHQRTTGAGLWGGVLMSTATLAHYARALTGHDLLAPAVGRVLRPSPPEWRRLLRLHARIGRIVETQPAQLGRMTVAHSVEQEVIEALVPCLTADDVPGKRRMSRDEAQIMVRFQEAITAQTSSEPLAELCALIDVSERSLQRCCSVFLGMSPGRYVRLRRLTLARSAILRIEQETVQVADIALRHGFSDAGRFAASYRAAFAETPLATLQRVRDLWRPRGFGKFV